jgi:hypothetical protein
MPSAGFASACRPTARDVRRGGSREEGVAKVLRRAAGMAPLIGRNKKGATLRRARRPYRHGGVHDGFGRDDAPQRKTVGPGQPSGRRRADRADRYWVVSEGALEERIVTMIFDESAKCPRERRAFCAARKGLHHMSDDSRMEDREQRILELAHRIWEEEDRPRGQADPLGDGATLILPSGYGRLPDRSERRRPGCREVCAIG